jgi:hypothetical protein
MRTQSTLKIWVWKISWQKRKKIQKLANFQIICDCVCIPAHLGQLWVQRSIEYLLLHWVPNFDFRSNIGKVRKKIISRENYLSSEAAAIFCFHSQIRSWYYIAFIMSWYVSTFDLGPYIDYRALFLENSKSWISAIRRWLKCCAPQLSLNVHSIYK